MVHSSLQGLHPTLSSWFLNRFHEPTAIQVQAWPSIDSRHHTLIASPTGSGKTLAALMPCLHSIVSEKNKADVTAQPGVRLLYIAPLKALNRDIYDHLSAYFDEISTYAKLHQLEWPELQVAVRTGDTSPKQRTALLRQPPDVLMTTPESLYLLLTSVRGKDVLRTVTHVVVDEIHDLAATKRGTHLSLSLERLTDITRNPPIRIGVSATQRPISRVANFLGGWDEHREERRTVNIVESEDHHQLDISIVTPNISFDRDKDAAWVPVLQEIMSLTEHVDRFMVFVNNRRLCERLTLRINDYLGYELAKSHHGSISKEARLSVEQSFKAGSLRCIVATSSLELGIDIGNVDLVIQIDSPTSAAIGIQRFGRAGHNVFSTSRGVIIAKNRNQLPEIAVLKTMMLNRDIDEIVIPRDALDVLTQHVVSMVTTEPWEVERLYKLIRRSDSYRNFPFERLESILRVLSGYFPFITPLIHWSAIDGMLHSRANTRLSAVLGVGTIAQSTGYPVFDHVSGVRIGELDEEFVHESRAGDVFQLGASSWMIRSIRHDKVTVAETSNRYSEIPFWKGESVSRSPRVGAAIGEWMLECEQALRDTTSNADVILPSGLDEHGEKHVAQIVKSQLEVSSIPTNRRIVVEQYRDDVNQTHVIVHSLFGRKFNRTWSLALEHVIQQFLGLKVYTTIKDNGIQFVFPRWDPRVLNVFRHVTSENLEDILLKCIPASPLFSITLRRTLETALLLSKGTSRTPIWLKRLRTEELLKQAIPYAESFPYLQEALKECLRYHLDVQSVKDFLGQTASGDIVFSMHRLVGPSPLSREFLADYLETKLYESDVIQSEVVEPLTRMDLAQLKRDLESDERPPEVLESVIEEERRQLSGRRHREFVVDEETTYRWMKRVGDVTLSEITECLGSEAVSWVNRLVSEHRVVLVTLRGRSCYVCADEHHTYQTLGMNDASLHFVVSRWMDQRLSFTASEIQDRYAIDSNRVRAFLDDASELGYVESSIIPYASNEIAWTSVRIADRIRRKSVTSTRQRYTSDVNKDEYVQLLLRHQFVYPASMNTSGIDGLRQVLDVLQGVFMTPREWENTVFPTRIRSYRKDDLDLLCATGEVIWVGRKSQSEKEGRVAFFFANRPDLYLSVISAKSTCGRASETNSRDVAPALDATHLELLNLLKEHGAMFLARLGALTGFGHIDLLDRLWVLVWAGLVSNDQFSPLRVLQSKKGAISAPLKTGVGRWYAVSALLSSEESTERQTIAWAEQLIKRQGVVAKQNVSDEVPCTWNSLRLVYERMEDLGRVVRGLHIRSIASIQYATPGLLTELNQQTQHKEGNRGRFSNDKPLVLSATDPANPYGITLPWPEQDDVKFSRKNGNFMVFLGGSWLLWMENGGRRVTVLDVERYHELIQDEDTLQVVIRDVFTQVFAQQGTRKTTIETWFGESIVGSRIEPALRRLGAQKQQNGFVLWKMIV